jgi:hypothetical protein
VFLLKYEQETEELHQWNVEWERIWPNNDIRISQSLDTHQNRSYRHNSWRDGQMYLFI